MGYTSDASRSTVTGALLFDEDALVSVHKPRSASAAPPMTRPLHAPPPLRSTDTGFRPGHTSNCASRYARHRRHSSTGSSRGSSRRTSAKQTDEPSFFVGDADPEDELLASVVGLGSNGDVTTTGSRRGSSRTTSTTTASSDRGSSRPRVSTRVQRSASLPVAHSPAQLRADSQRSRTATQPAREQKMKPRKMVTFKNAYEPEIMPDHRPNVQSYDELLFNVGGLYHTLSYLHDPDFLDEPDAGTDTNSDSDHSSSDRQMQLERSMQLMIAEFLYRSAVYLGYPPDDNVWVPGFREKKKFSSNDVKRWRRLAHFNWEEEEVAFDRQRAQRRAQANERARQRAQTRERARASSTGLRATVSDWLHRRTSPREPTPVTTVTSLALEDKPLPPLVLDPPLVPSAVDLSRLVEIANSCISYGAFRFTERQIRKLCNVPIKHY